MNRGYPIILGGYISWGLFPLYWAMLTEVPAFEVLLHRMLWSVPVLLLLILISQRRRTQVRSSLKSWHEIRWLLLTGLLVTFNWGIYIWAVVNHRVVEASMGYFLTPLLNVLAGVIVFREKLGRLNKIAICFAGCGVAYYILNTAIFPWVALSAGTTFAAYGMLRKQMSINAVPGLFIETLLLLPFTLSLVLWLHYQGEAMFLNLGRTTDLWLILAGPITIIPLALFTAGTRLLPMTTVGILFYVTPSLQFLIGIWIFNEAFNLDKMIGFVGIWIGLAIFSYSLISGSSVNQQGNSA
jgi:chloramphenicol-sensitive protein RarD